jgi:hypothetical protein
MVYKIIIMTLLLAAIPAKEKKPVSDRQERKAERGERSLFEKRKQIRMTNGKTNELWVTVREFPTMFSTPRMITKPYNPSK